MLDYNELKKLEDRYEDYINSNKKIINFEYFKKISLKNNKDKIKYIIAILIILLSLIIMLTLNNEADNKNTTKNHILKNEKKQPQIQDLEFLKQRSEEAKRKYQIHKQSTSLSGVNSFTSNEKQGQNIESTLPKQGWIKLNNIDEDGDSSSKSNAKKDTIKISSSNIEEQINELKSKFESSKNLEYALALANIYYEKRMFSKSAQWALNANEVDSDNQESWILFAKSKYKLNFKQDAIKVLKTYNKNKNNEKIALLIKIMEENKL